MIGLKRSDICSERKSWNDSYFSVESTFQESVTKQNFYVCARGKKAMPQRHSAYIPSSVKSPLLLKTRTYLVVDFTMLTYLTSNLGSVNLLL